MIKELREYAWKYFDRHAEQRLKAFNFYVLLCGAAIAGIAAVLKDASGEWLGIPLSAILSFVSFVFWKLDQRTRVLINHSEEALKVIEDQMNLPDEGGGAPHRCKLFCREDYDRKLAPAHEFSYTKCFGLVFLLFGFGGVILCIYLSLVPK